MNMILLLYQITTTMPHLTTLSSVCIFIYHCSIFHYEHIVSTPDMFRQFLYHVYFVQQCTECVNFILYLSDQATAAQKTWNGLLWKRNLKMKMWAWIQAKQIHNPLCPRPPARYENLPLIYTIFIYFELEGSVMKMSQFLYQF